MLRKSMRHAGVLSRQQADGTPSKNPPGEDDTVGVLTRIRRPASVTLGFLLTLLVFAMPTASAEYQQLPWATFSEASADAVSADEVACPGTPNEPVLRARLIHEEQKYVYMVKQGRWVVWLVERMLPNGDAVPTWIWFGSQDGSDDVMRVVKSMPYDEAQTYFRGPCAWIDIDTI